MTQAEITIVAWEPNRLAITGFHDAPGVLLTRLLDQSCSPFVGFRNGPKFTYSFPERDARAVARIIERLP